MIDEKKHADKIAFFRVQIENLRDRTGETIRELIRNSPFDEIKKDPPLTEEFARYFESVYEVTQETGVIIRETDYEPWLNDLRSNENFTPYYWERFKEYLRHTSKFPPEVINALDNDTDQILDHSGNPQLDDPWKKRGMVLGHVQSGKTTNYSSLICKAADTGYKIIILLSGTSNLLRKQTQQRIDDSFIGRTSSTVQNKRRRTTGVGKHSPPGQQKRYPTGGTTVWGDFNIREARAYGGVHIHSLKDPIIFVVKKNRGVLKNLREWLQDEYPQGDVPHPLLLIDDEADNASINTKREPDKVTKINGEIRGILSLFSRSSYIGYTATPFANIFITPDSEMNMLGEDLFPSDFIQSLEPPSNYIGPNKVFLDEKYSGQIIRDIEDFDDFVPLRHNSSLQVTAIPESLLRAVRLFILCRSIMICEGSDKRHATMMINVSILKKIQGRVSGLVSEYLDTIKNAIRLNANSRKDDNIVMRKLKNDFETEYGEGREWDEIRAQLIKASADISVRTVNTGGDSLDYEAHTKNGLHVIAVGGLSLSRGLTLEGLCISYLIRNAGAYDTLMQMGRWFGYRGGYEDICRVFLPRITSGRYDFVSDAMNELREEIKMMNLTSRTPREFGLRVRRHPATIFQITARNKMMNAQYVNVALDFSCSHQQPKFIFASENINKKNYEYAKEFKKHLGMVTQPSHPRHSKHLFWSGVDVKNVLDLISTIQLPNDRIDWLTRIGGNEEHPLTFVHQYILDRRQELGKWDVCVPRLSNDGGIRERKQGWVQNDIYAPRGRRVLADRQDAGIGLSDNQWKTIARKTKKEVKDLAEKDFNQERTTPLLLLHIFDAKEFGKETSFFSDVPAVAYSICFPDSEVRAPEHKYATNIVYQQQCFDFEDDEGDDVEEDDE